MRERERNEEYKRLSEEKTYTNVFFFLFFFN